MRTKLLALAVGAALLAGAGVASAATVENDLNLRAGPGTNYPVVGTMPAGAHVNVRDCNGSWCRVSFRGETGWASASYLGGGGGATTVYRTRAYAEPSYGYVEPGYAYGPDYYDDGAYAYSPGVSFGIGFGGGGWGRGWHGGGWGGHGGWRR